MKRLLSSFALAFLFAATTQAAQQPPKFDLEMTGQEWEKVMDRTFNPFSSIAGGDPLDIILATGKRNLDWLRHINSTRTTKISLTDPSTMNGIPIESPKEYSDQTTIKAYNDIIPQLPPTMKKVLIDGDAFTDPGVPDDEYIKWGHKMDVIYQTAARWRTLQPWLTYMIGQKQKDVRGHYFLSKDPDRDTNLNNFASLPTATKANYRLWLTANCMNSGMSETICKSEVSNAESSNRLKDFYDSYKSDAQRNWDTFFKIPNGIRFSSLTWSKSTPDLAVIPFTDPNHTEKRDYLWQNIEEEWKWLTWQLKLDFNSSASNKVNVHWQPGVTPHVSGLGSSEVFMDSNAPLTEWDVRWTIRHEFGHVVGMPDCYLEFYDQARHLIVSYQHDITDLMCSRRGRFKENHFLEMKRVYFN